MKRIVGYLFLSCLFLAGCGTKKRSTLNKGETNSVSNRSNSPEGDYPLPPDQGRFKFVPTASPEEYIKNFSGIAQAEMQAYGIPASITLAQGLLESGFGNGALTRKTNNHFGIKCHTGWEGDYERHDDDARGECFRKYNHPMYSYRDHSIFLTTRSRYASLFELRKNDYKGWARGLKAAGYATDRKYPQKLIALIERYQLYRFDSEVLGEEFTVTAGLASSDGGGHSVHEVQAGDTLYALSRRYYMTVEELMQINGLDSTEISIGQLLKVKPEKVKK